MITIKRLSECTLEEAVKAWNNGFEGYFVNLTTTNENFIKRMASEELSPALSIVAFSDNEPVGIVENGIRTINGVKTAWNGGTAVATAFRNQGVGRLLMEKTLSIYREEGVELATLEAISENSKAIALYESLGYKIVDQLEYLELNGTMSDKPSSLSGGYSVNRVIPQQIGFLPFYKGKNPWQTQWQSAKEAEAIILADDEGIEAGYAYYRRSFSDYGVHTGTVLYQCEAAPGRNDGAKIIHTLLNSVFGSFCDEIRRVVINLPKSKSELTYNILSNIGFKPVVSLVMMDKEL